MADLPGSDLPRKLPDGLRRAVHDAAAAHVGDDLVPGLVALVAHGDDVHVEALGSLGIGRPPVRRDSIFRIASTTKPITGAATLALVEEGLLDLDEPVGRLLPELAQPRVLRRIDGPLDDTEPAQRAITPRDLLTFTFGFGLAVEMFSAPTPWPVVEAANALRAGHARTARPGGAARPGHLDRPPRQPAAGRAARRRWLYNTGAQVLGVLLARAAGQPLSEVLRTRMFEPLGMRDTGFFTLSQDRLATAYRATAAGLEAYDGPDGVWSRPQAFSDAAAGLVSTVDDLLAFARMLLRGGTPVLTSGAVGAMTSDQLTRRTEGSGAVWVLSSLRPARGATACGWRPTAGSAGTAGSARRGWSIRRMTSPSSC